MACSMYSAGFPLELQPNRDLLPLFEASRTAAREEAYEYVPPASTRPQLDIDRSLRLLSRTIAYTAPVFQKGSSNP